MFSGQKLKEIREAQGMSQASVAKHLGISRSSYFNWENGKTKPNQLKQTEHKIVFGSPLPLLNKKSHKQLLQLQHE